MYHPSRGGVRGGRDQFNWDEVKSDKHRENYIGHSVKAPVGRWQKGKDLTWYAKDKMADPGAEEALKAEIKKIKEEEEQAMRELLGLAPKREKRTLGSRLDKQETAELFKRGKTEEELAPGYVEGERVQGLGFAPAPRHASSKGALLQQTSFQQRMPQAEQSEGLSVSSPTNETCKHKDDGDIDRRKEKRDAKEKRREEKKEARKDKRHKSDSDASRHHKKRVRESLAY